MLEHRRGCAIVRSPPSRTATATAALRKQLGLIIVGLMLGCSPVTKAGPFEDGLDAHERGDYATALKRWRLAADQGDARAQFNLGLMYRNAEGVPLDYAQAVKWYRLAAGQGLADAQFSLGLMYESAQGIARDDKEAMKWYRLAAAQGDWKAQTGLAWIYAIGEGVPQDYVRAHLWFTFAASSSSGHDASMQVHLRDALAAHMTQAQLAQAREMARKCRQSDFKDCD